MNDTLNQVHVSYVGTTMFYLVGNPNTPIVGNKRWSGLSHMCSDNIPGGPGFQITHNQNWHFNISLRKWQDKYSVPLSQEWKVEAWDESAS
jgi:hypothetical protein